MEIQRVWIKGKRYIIKPIKHEEDCTEIDPKSTAIDSNVYDSRQWTSTTVDDNKKNLRKESNLKESITFSNTKENDKPSSSSELISSKNQKTNLPATKTNSLNQLQEINTLDLPDEFLERLISIRKANKASVNKESMKAVYREMIKLKEAGLDLNECLSIYANCGWKGFFADWFVNLKTKKQTTHLDHESTEWGEKMKNDPFFQNIPWI